MDMIQQTLVNTPWWVYALFAYLLYIGLKATQTRVMPLKKLFILPAIFLYLSLHNFVTGVNLTMLTLGSFTVATLLGVYLGWLFVMRFDIKVDKEKFLLQIPGNWSTLIIILIIFATKYFFSYQLAIDPQRLVDTGFEVTMLAVSGLLTGFLIGRLLRYLYCLQTGTSVNLTRE